MKNNFTTLFSLLLFSMYFAACVSPKAVIRVEPVAEPDKWNYGQAIVESKKNGLITSASFAYSDPDFLVFDVEVTNWREERILIDPAQISMQLTDAHFSTSAIDPEQYVLDMEIEASRREANAKNAAIVAGVVAVAAVTAAVVADANNDNGNENGFVNNGGVDAVNLAPTVFINSGGGVAPSGVPQTVDPWFWSDHTLRKTTLERGEMVRGKVVFPRDDSLPHFELVVPVEEITFNFSFKQIIYQPK